ncbi:MAG: phospholipase D family protein [Treponema sp.]|nr:phospholipase D family protein [Treponema sp.]
MFGKKKTTEKKTSSTKNSSKKPAAKKLATKTTKAVSKTQTQDLAEIIRQKQPSEPEFQYIANEDHYDKVIEKIKDCTKTLWIGTADIKDLYVKDGRGTKPLLEVLSDLAKRGVEIRLIHAKEPGPAFRQDFDKYPDLIDGMERVLCPRVHFKIIVFDLKTAYVGSANLTGAGLGMKGEKSRNFEAGVLSSNKDFVKNAAEQFDSVWMGAHCKGCRRKEFCGDPIGL